MAADPVLARFDDSTGIARIAFNRPDVLNAIDVPMAQAFRDAVLNATARPNLRCLVLGGAGRAFMAGGDVASFAQEPERVVDALLEAIHPAILAMRSCPAPVLAAVAGPAAGAGLSFVLGADLVIASERARFLIAYDRIGASPDCGGTWFLPRRVGRAKAFEMMLLGQALDAEAAREAGIVAEVVAAEALDARVDEIASRIASGPTLAYGHFKRLVDAAAATSLADQLEAERRAFLEATRSADFRAGVAAFVGKGAPAFSGG